MNRLTLAFLIFSTVLCIGCQKDDPEEEEPALKIQTSEFCEDTCIFSGDGECDDGGSNSDSDFCEYGTDCSDCGLRTLVRVVDR